jgi:hypothetical protein
MQRGHAVDAVTIEFLRWVSMRRATYAQAQAAWQTTSCPRHSAWEDAFIDGLVQLEHLDGHDEAVVTLTDRGRALI